MPADMALTLRESSLLLPTMELVVLVLRQTQRSFPSKYLTKPVKATHVTLQQVFASRQITARESSTCHSVVQLKVRV
jgi:hypothetical protein